jgi:uncharacterized membrane protein (Fun14 family)
MTAVADFAPFFGTIGGGFFVGLIAGYAIKKIMKILAVIVGLLIAALAYLEYQRIITVDWMRIQTLSQNGLTWTVNTITHISNNIGAPHSAVSNLGFSDVVPLASSVSAGLTLGLVRG